MKLLFLKKNVRKNKALFSVSKNNDVSIRREKNMSNNVFLEKAKYFIFPNKGRYANFNKFPEETIKFPIIEDSMYGTYPLNKHHFKPFYHIQYVLPILCESLNIPYDINDFNVIEKFEGKHDISYLEFKKECYFDLHDMINDEKYENVDFSYLRKCDLKDDSINEYHRIFRYPHRCGHIINKTINNDRILVISCDSQMIPIMPVLACYFKEIWHLDNRQNKEVIKHIDPSKVTDVVVVGGFNEEEKYTVKNFK